MDTEIANQSPTSQSLTHRDMQVPPFPRAPENGTRLANENMVARIDNKIKKLAALGLLPHPTMLGYRKELREQLDHNGPYELRWSTGIF